MKISLLATLIMEIGMKKTLELGFGRQLQIFPFVPPQYFFHKVKSKLNIKQAGAELGQA